MGDNAVINVSEEALRDFSNYVSNFSQNIQINCDLLSSALDSLSATMDQDSIDTIQRTVTSIKKVIDDEQPAIVNLQQKVNAYADFIHRLKEL